MSSTKISKYGIAYEERGSGAAFVALHGYSLDRRMSIGAFEPLFEARAKKGGTSQGYRRIYADLPFMGESTDTSEGEGHDGMLAAMVAFVREVAPEGPILLAGESYGGYLARGLARELGERVHGLFFLCPSVVARRNGRDLPRREVRGEESGWREAAKAAGATEVDIADYEEHAVTRSLEAFERTRAEIIAGIRIARIAELERYLGGKQTFSFDHLGNGGQGDEPFDRPFAGPVCFVLGRQDISVGWRDALRLADCYPHASYHVLDGAGHNAQIDRPDLFAATFSRWLAALETEGLMQLRH
jgi:pimeloyl-ACP methyl ester carboxylesterase